MEATAHRCILSSFYRNPPPHTHTQKLNIFFCVVFFNRFPQYHQGESGRSFKREWDGSATGFQLLPENESGYVNLAQVQILWEVSNQCGESLMVPVLGMRGGFSLDLDLEDEDGSGEVVFHQESTVVKPLQLVIT